MVQIAQLKWTEMHTKERASALPGRKPCQCLPGLLHESTQVNSQYANAQTYCLWKYTCFSVFSKLSYIWDTFLQRHWYHPHVQTYLRNLDLMSWKQGQMKLLCIPSPSRRLSAGMEPLPAHCIILLWHFSAAIILAIESPFAWEVPHKIMVQLTHLDALCCIDCGGGGGQRWELEFVRWFILICSCKWLELLANPLGICYVLVILEVHTALG